MVEQLPAARQICKFWIDFWFSFLVIFWYQFNVHPDVTKYAREYDMLLKRDARGGRETKRLEQRSAALTCARGPDVSARWCDRGRLGALSEARRAPRAKRMGAARKGVRWRGARWSGVCSEARACGVAAKGLQALPMVLQAGLCVSRRAAERCQLSGASCRCAGDALGDQVCAASAAAARGAAQARARRAAVIALGIALLRSESRCVASACASLERSPRVVMGSRGAAHLAAFFWV